MMTGACFAGSLMIIAPVTSCVYKCNYIYNSNLLLFFIKLQSVD